MQGNGSAGHDLASDLQAQVAVLNRQNTRHKDQLAELEHKKKKELLEIRTELQFERKKASQLQDKFKQLLLQKQDASNYRSISTELTAELSNKDTEIQDLRKLIFQLKRHITELESEVQASPLRPSTNTKHFLQEINNLKIEKARIQQGAVSAIMEKDSVIQDLEDEIRELRQNANATSELLEVKEKYEELEEKLEKMVKENQENHYFKDNEITELKERIELIKTRSEERAARLENDINEYQSYIERLKEEKTHDDSLAENYDILVEKNRKTEKHIQELEVSLNDLKLNSQDEIKRLQFENQGLKQKIETLKVYETNFNNLEKDNQRQRKLRQKQIHDLNQTIEHLTQSKSEFIHKNMELEAEKNRLLENLEDYRRQINDTFAEKEKYVEKFNDLNDNFSRKLQQQKEFMIVGDEYHVKSPIKSAETETLKTEQTTGEDDHKFKRDTLQEEIEKTELLNSRKKDQEENNVASETLKKHNAQLEQRIKELEGQITDKMTEIQSNREKILKMSEQLSSNQKQQSLKVEIEELKSHLLKIENNLLIVKLKSAQDENFWRDRQIADRKEFAEKEAQFIRQKTQLYEKIEKLRKSKGQAKSDYYQSSLR